MTVELLVFGIVPVCVTILMFGVGLNLSLISISQILRSPRSLVVATLLQIVLLPALALAMIAVFEPEPLAALAVMAIAVSPGGALSNTFTHLVRGNLGFSVMMTTVSTILVSATAPVVLAAAHTSGMLDQGAAARLDPVTVTFDLLRITLLPIGLGVLAVNFLPGAAARLRRAADALGIVAIATVLLSSTVVSLPALHQTAPGPLLLALLFSLGSLSLGILASRALPRADRSACFMEFGVRNLPVALVLTSGGSPTVELVAFLLCYLVVNASILVAVALLARSRIGSVAA